MRNTRTNQKIPGSEDNGDEETSFGPVDVIFVQLPRSILVGKTAIRLRKAMQAAK